MIRLIVLCFFLLLCFGCNKTEVQVQDKPVPWMKAGTNEKMVFKAPVEAAEVPLAVLGGERKPVEFKPADTHKVVKGECLWFIAEYRGVYGDPFMWPEIYKANRHQIDNPDLIYPGQELIIPR